MTRRVNGTIFVVEDDPDIGALLRGTLESRSYRVRLFGTGGDALRAFKQESMPDLCIIDLGLPDMDGLEVMRAIANPRTGCIILTGRGDSTDRILGLEMGADDYIAKPFEPRELLARVNAYFRRLDRLSSTTEDGSRCAHFAGWVFDPATMTLAPEADEDPAYDPKSGIPSRPRNLPCGIDADHATPAELGAAEAGLLMAFLKAPKRVLSREALLDSVGRAADPAFDRSIDVRVSRLRKRIEGSTKSPKVIRTVYGAGYVLSAPVEWRDPIE